ncbi:hypothetical protein F4779DRAFT_629798 [Xylariaceae sp. FL0662B]|nr:hypothetical protein F4779DRAFT_629798 [Xylariaceae sp. FL0662B]
MVGTRLGVAMVGGEISGLAAAAILRQKHDVTVYERNPALTKEIGGAIGIGPNGTRMAKILDGTKTYSQSGELIKEFTMDCEHPKVVDITAGTLAFSDGTTVTADLIIGMRSGLAESPLSPANLSMYRWTFPLKEIQELLGYMLDCWEYEDRIFLSTFLTSDGSNRNVIAYPCREMKIVNVGCAIPYSYLSSLPTEASRTTSGDISKMKALFLDFPPWLQKLMANINELKLYRLWDQDRLQRYYKGQAISVGDAAHPTVPCQGQGANQALEDAEVFQLLLYPTLDKDNLPSLLSQWESVRLHRASEIQRNSRYVPQIVSRNSSSAS